MIRRPRLTFEDKFTQVPNEWVRDPRISRKARGLLVELMSHSEGWVTSIEALAEGGPEGRTAISAGIKELVEAGYLIKDRLRDEQGQLGDADYVITDPHENPRSEPKSGFPALGNPALGNQQHKKTKIQEDQKSKKAAPKPEAKEPQLLLSESGFTAADLDDDDKAWARATALHVDLNLEWQKFLLHAESTQKRHARWKAAWKTWVLNAETYAVRDGAPLHRPKRSSSAGSPPPPPRQIETAEAHTARVRAEEEAILAEAKQRWEKQNG